VTTRYGTLVDAFSVSSQALSDRLGAYDVPRSKRRVIHTGVDAEREFAPARAAAVPSLDRARLQILFPARVTAQKDPLLMAAVAERLRDDGVAFQIHVVGDGDIIGDLRERIAALDLGDSVILHGECLDVAPWYAASDVVLLTSEFEGVPYVAYEAMAMATPVVAPGLPGLQELVTPPAGLLVTPRDDPGAYAAAIGALAADPDRRRRMGEAGRDRVLTGFSLARMAGEHAALYDELLAGRPGSRALPAAHVNGNANGNGHANGNGNGASLVLASAFRDRRPGTTPLVSVIVPCFNHGHFLDECLRSIAAQEYAPLEVIVVDDGSTDPETLDALARARLDGAQVLRLPTNRGPSAARNAALEHARGRYVLPVDADNLLLPGAIQSLVVQLAGAGEQVGFVYPNCQFFGNRTDYLEFPTYNLYSQLSVNTCDTSSLFDREVFDRGFRYPEDMVLGHEDWDFVLTLAEHGIHGEVAHAKTLLYRKHAFTRSDLVDAADVPFGEVLERRHPALFDPPARARLKGRWNPAVTIVALDPIGDDDDAASALVAAIEGQTCEDFELVIRTAEEIGPTPVGPRLRRIPRALAESRAQGLAQGLEIARGRWTLALYGSPAALLGDRALVEKVLWALRLDPQVRAVALADADPGLSPFRLLRGGDAERAALGAVCWETLGENAPPPSFELPGARPLEGLSRWLSAHHGLQWRQVHRDVPPVGCTTDPDAVTDPGDGPPAALGAPQLARARDAGIRGVAPELPAARSGLARRLQSAGAWAPPHARPLCRHYELRTGRYLYTNSSAPPPGCRLDYVLGYARALPLAGTVSLSVRESDGDLSIALGEALDLDAPELLGFLEEAPLPLLERVFAARHRATGRPVLVAGSEDPIGAAVDLGGPLGYVEPYPLKPRGPARVDAGFGLAGLVRTVDHAARRHRYAAGVLPAGRLAGELGALLIAPAGDCEPLWIDEHGHVFASALGGHDGRPALATATRWAYDPLTWGNFSSAGPKLRASARRAIDLPRLFAAQLTGTRARPARPAGYLLTSPAPRTLPLYAAVHLVTGDQLLCTNASELDGIGYGPSRLLGHIIASAPVTGTLGIVRPGVPWASHFGMAARHP